MFFLHRVLFSCVIKKEPINALCVNKLFGLHI
nr:MAG TPA: hypothetical protein [Caudoviricetes sp.]